MSDIAALYRDVFETDSRGRTVLENLERRFCSQPAVVTSGGIDAILTTYERAAQRAVLDFIHAQIARANAVGEPAPVNPLART